MPDHDIYERWIERRKRVEVPPGFADNTVHRAEQTVAEAARSTVFAPPSLLDAVGTSPVASFAVCSAAMLIGLVPFIYIAYVARLVSF